MCYDEFVENVIRKFNNFQFMTKMKVFQINVRGVLKRKDKSHSGNNPSEKKENLFDFF